MEREEEKTYFQPTKWTKSPQRPKHPPVPQGTARRRLTIQPSRQHQQCKRGGRRIRAIREDKETNAEKKANKKCTPQAQHKANSHTSPSMSSSFPIPWVYTPPISQNRIFSECLLRPGGGFRVWGRGGIRLGSGCIPGMGFSVEGKGERERREEGRKGGDYTPYQREVGWNYNGPLHHQHPHRGLTSFMSMSVPKPRYRTHQSYQTNLPQPPTPTTYKSPEHIYPYLSVQPPQRSKTQEHWYASKPRGLSSLFLWFCARRTILHAATRWSSKFTARYTLLWRR